MTAEKEVVDFNKDIVILPLENWLNFALGRDESVFVALPLIQRGFVWKPNQIIDLWDTLLRGMPVGSLIFSPMPPGIDVRKIGKKELGKTTETGAIGLIDGQQRTLSMLIPWLDIEDIDRRIWVDFADTPGDGHLFRLRVTTKNQPFGFQKAAPSAKLSLSDKRNALKPFIKEPNEELPEQDVLFKEGKPYLSKCPIDLKDLIDEWKKQKGNRTKWIESIEYRINENKLNLDEENYKSKVSNFADSLERLFNLKIPLLKVDKSIFNPVAEINPKNNDETIDPPLAVLFKRIGTGGTALSDADYAFSVIKHHLPESYTLVEHLHDEENIASLLSATDLVMTTVRLAAAEYSPSITDWESPNKREFHSLIKKDKNAENGFLETGFLPLIKNGTLKAAFSLLTNLLKYNSDTNPKGLPLHAFPVLNRPLVQVLLRWIRCVQLNSLNNVASVLNNNREEVLRFIMYWQLCVTDPKKASFIAFQYLHQTDTNFPGLKIYDALFEKNVAIPIFSPAQILEINRNVIYADSNKLRGWKRFIIKQETEEKEKKVIQLYNRWWGSNPNRYTHPLLLWLQREAVDKFKGNPVAGREEDTPYDYDHICPSKHWGDWTGAGASTDSLWRFVEKNDDGRGHVYVGNSIGNLRVWDSSKNRSDGDNAPNIKLEFDNPKQDERDKLLEQSAINLPQIEKWLICSGELSKERSWSPERALAFQQVVEQRAFSLYECFYNELGFSAWLEKLPETAAQPMTESYSPA